MASAMSAVSPSTHGSSSAVRKAEKLIPVNLAALPLPTRRTPSPAARVLIGDSRSNSPGALGTMAREQLRSPDTSEVSAPRGIWVSPSLPPSPSLPTSARPLKEGNRERRRPGGGEGIATADGGRASMFRDWSATASLLDKILETPSLLLVSHHGGGAAGGASSSLSLSPAWITAATDPAATNAGNPASPSSSKVPDFASTATAAPLQGKRENPLKPSSTFPIAPATVEVSFSALPGALTAASPLQPHPPPPSFSFSRSQQQRQQQPAVPLTSNGIPPPSILLLALADMDELLRTLCAHIRVNPVKDQLSEFKRLVATSLQSELAQGGALAPSATHASHYGHVSGEHEVHALGERGEASMGDSSPSESSIHAHGAALRAALRAAHGFLYSNETVPTGVPVTHLQRARRQWIAQYGPKHVQPWLHRTQRRRYEAWMQQSRASRGRAVPSPVQPIETALSACPALRPSYWRYGVADRGSVLPSHYASTAVAATSETSEKSGLSGRNSHTRSQLWTSASAASPTRAVSSSKAPSVQYDVAWEVDLYDDLGVAVTAEEVDWVARQATSRDAIEEVDSEKASNQGDVAELPGRTPASAGGPAAPLAAAPAAPPLVFDHPGDVTNVLIPLPSFVYVVSRYLFLTYYAMYFPAGLFSRALIDPYYFPHACECTPQYALRTTPALRREAQRVHDAYAAQLADAHRCFPERASITEVPLPPEDLYHFWELLCPPQRQDIAGRWQPLPWGPLQPGEEEALLQEEYAAPPLPSGYDTKDSHAFVEQPLLSYPYARAARYRYRRQLQELAQHPTVLAEVRRLQTQCEAIAAQFFALMDTEQKGSITWEDLTNALIEEADVQDHQRKVRERASHLTRTSASVFDRYVVEPLAPTLARLGYTGNVFEIRHSASLVLLEGAADYAVCDGTQLGSIHQRFLVRPMEVVHKELEGEPRDAFGRLIHAGSGDRDDGKACRGGGHVAPLGSSDAGGYDVALRQRPWQTNQRPSNVFLRYEDGRRLQESTALGVLQQLSSSTVGAGGTTAEGEENEEGDGEGGFASSRPHQPVKPVLLEGVMAVEDVSPCVPWPVFVARSNDMLLRLYGTNRAVQAMPEAGVLRCTETVTCMDWAAGGPLTRRSDNNIEVAERLNVDSSSGNIAPAAGATNTTCGPVNGQQQQRPGSAAGRGERASLASSTQLRSQRDRMTVQRQEYLLLGTRSGTILLVDLYALLNQVPRLAMLAGKTGDADNEKGTRDGIASTMGNTSAVLVAPTISERIGSSDNAWTGYRALAQRTYYSDIAPFVVHKRQVHLTGTIVSSVFVARTTGLAVSSGLDGDVFTMRLVHSPAWVASTGALRALNSVTDGVDLRPAVRIEVLHRLRICDAGVSIALPIPCLSMLAVLTVANKVYLYHFSVLPSASALTEGGKGGLRPSSSASSRSHAAVEPQEDEMNTPLGAPTSSSNATTTSRLELYDASAPHLGTIVTMIAVEQLDQLITVGANGYVKVWSLRQSQPLTSFFALSPIDTSVGGSSHEVLERSTGRTSAQGGVRRRNSGGGAASSSLLRMTKGSIEAAVETAEYRLQPCRTAAYNYGGRQLFVMGSRNAAHCFFLSGQSSVRAHTDPLRVLLVETEKAPQTGRVPRRLVSLSSADCRIWSLVTGTMELGIRAGNAEFRRLFDHRLTGNARARMLAKGKTGTIAERTRSSPGRRGTPGRGGSGNGGRSATRGRPPIPHAEQDSKVGNASVVPSTTGEPRRLLPPSLNDVIHAVTGRLWNGGSAGRSRRPATAGSFSSSGHQRSAKLGVTAPSQLLTALRHPRSNPGDGAVVETDGEVTNAPPDENLISSDIRCACLGPGGYWIGYALLHGDIRLHRSDSGRLLHTFITTPPSVEDLVEAAMQNQHLFSLTAAAATPSSAHSVGANLNGGGTAGQDPASHRSAVKLPSSKANGLQPPPTAPLTPIAYAQAVAVVLQQLLSSTTTTTTGGTVRAAATSSNDPEDYLTRNVHREPLHMFYLEASQEVLVVYADGLLRSFTLLSRSTTATRVIVSRTLMNRALHQVKRVLIARERGARVLRGVSSPNGDAASGARSVAGTQLLHSMVPLQELLLTGAVATVGLVDVEESEDQSFGGEVSFPRSLRAAHRGESAGSLAHGGADGTSSFSGGTSALPLPSGDSPSAAASGDPARVLLRSLPTRQIEPDVVLLATASVPLGLVCLVHASGLVTVIDVLAHGESGSAPLVRFASGDATSGGRRGITEEGSGSGKADPTASDRAQAGVVVHSFTTTDEVTAALFLGAYPCLVLADRHYHLTFHLVKGSSLLAMLGGDFAEQLEKDATAYAPACREQTDTEANQDIQAWRSQSDPRRETSNGVMAVLRTTAHQRAFGGGSRGAGTTTSPKISSPTMAASAAAATMSTTLVWTVSIEESCATQLSLGTVTALAFDALYATLYVGTSQGFIISYLVRRFLAAFQLVPVYLRGVAGVAASTYAAELQRSLAVPHPAAASPPPPVKAGHGPDRPFCDNYRRIVLDLIATVPPTTSRTVSPVRPASTTMEMKDHRSGEVPRSFNSTPMPVTPFSATFSRSPMPASDAMPLWSGVLPGTLEEQSSTFMTALDDATERQRSSSYASLGLATMVVPSTSSRPTIAPPGINMALSVSEVLTAAAVVHDAVTRTDIVASVGGTNDTYAYTQAPILTEDTQPWWRTQPGRVVQEYVERQYGGAQTGSVPGLHCKSAAAPARASAPMETERQAAVRELELDMQGLTLLRRWVMDAVAQHRRLQQQQQAKGSDTALSTPQSAMLQGAERRFQSPAGRPCPRGSVNASTRSSVDDGRGLAATPLSLTSLFLTRDPVTPNARDRKSSLPSRIEGGSRVDIPSLGGTVDAEKVAEALVQEVHEELLFGEAANHAAGSAGLPVFSAASLSSHPITDWWVECLFTRQTMCMTSRSPLALLTTPAMLERARRERQDRLGKRAIALTLGSATVPEWDAYVEGALPDYLEDMLSHPGQVLTEVERQALQQRSILALQCRRNGYLCAGHADGGVTLWTPYACARLESLCPSTSLSATLDRLAASAKAQFRYLHERMVRERRRLAFEVSIHTGRYTEEEGNARMKRRIRAMLLEHHLAQLQVEQTSVVASEGQAGEEGVEEWETTKDSLDPTRRPLRSPPRSKGANRRRGQSRIESTRNSSAAMGLNDSAAGGKYTRPPCSLPFGVFEEQLLPVRPLLCLLLGISSPAEVRARQLSTEDLCFLPFHARSLASLEAFHVSHYNAAVDIAIRRLRRELVEDGDSGVQGPLRGTPRSSPDPLAAAVTQVATSVALGKSSILEVSSQGSLPAVCSPLHGRPGSVYEYRLDFLVRIWGEAAQQLSQATEASTEGEKSTTMRGIGIAAFPGAVRLLLHRAMEGAPCVSHEHDTNLTVPAAAAVVADPAGRTTTPPDTATEKLGEQARMTHADGAAAARPPLNTASTSAAAVVVGVPQEGLYYEVCHALQEAEMQAEVQWEVEELSRAWRRLQAATATTAKTFTTSPTPLYSTRSNAIHLQDDDGGTLSQLPPNRAAAVSAAVQRQVQRGLETRLAALSQRAVGTALLRNLHIKSHSAPAGSLSAGALTCLGERACHARTPLASLFRRSGGVAWVHAGLQQQIARAFSEPRLTFLSTAHATRPHFGLSTSGFSPAANSLITPTRRISVKVIGSNPADLERCGTRSTSPTHALPRVISPTSPLSGATDATAAPPQLVPGEQPAAVQAAVAPHQSATNDGDTAATSTAAAVGWARSATLGFTSVIEDGAAEGVTAGVPPHGREENARLLSGFSPQLCRGESELSLPFPCSAEVTVSPADAARSSPFSRVQPEQTLRHTDEGMGPEGFVAAAPRGFWATSPQEPPPLSPYRNPIASYGMHGIPSRTSATTSCATTSSPLSFALVSNQAPQPVQPLRQQMLPPVAGRRIQLARTGSSGGVRQPRRSKTNLADRADGVGGAALPTRKTAPLDRCATAGVRAAGRSASAATLTPYFTRAKRRGSSYQSDASNRAAAAQPMTYYTLHGLARNC